MGDRYKRTAEPGFAFTKSNSKPWGGMTRSCCGSRSVSIVKWPVLSVAVKVSPSSNVKLALASAKTVRLAKAVWLWPDESLTIPSIGCADRCCRGSRVSISGEARLFFRASCIKSPPRTTAELNSWNMEHACAKSKAKRQYVDFNQTC